MRNSFKQIYEKERKNTKTKITTANDDFKRYEMENAFVVSIEI